MSVANAARWICGCCGYSGRFIIDPVRGEVVCPNCGCVVEEGLPWEWLHGRPGASLDWDDGALRRGTVAPQVVHSKTFTELSLTMARKPTTLVRALVDTGLFGEDEARDFADTLIKLLGGRRSSPETVVKTLMCILKGVGNKPGCRYDIELSAAIRRALLNHRGVAIRFGVRYLEQELGRLGLRRQSVEFSGEFMVKAHEVMASIEGHIGGRVTLARYIGEAGIATAALTLFSEDALPTLRMIGRDDIIRKLRLEELHWALG